MTQKTYITKRDLHRKIRAHPKKKAKPLVLWGGKGSGRRKGKILVVRKSCLTGKVVWLYWGSSQGAARWAYHHACEEEIKRVNNWGERAEARRRNILKLLDECLSYIPITEALTPEQAEAARRLRNLSKEDIACHREFYEHIMEERRRREEDREIRKKMRGEAE